MKDNFLELIANEDISKLYYKVWFNPLVELEFNLIRREKSEVDGRERQILIYKALGNDITKELALFCYQSHISQQV